MKKFLRSSYVKFAAVVLSAICVWICAYECFGIVCGMVEEPGYRLEENFDDSEAATHLHSNLVYFANDVLQGLAEKYSAFRSEEENKSVLRDMILAQSPDEYHAEYYILIKAGDGEIELTNSDSRDKDYFSENLGVCYETTGRDGSSGRNIDNLKNAVILSHAEAWNAQRERGDSSVGEEYPEEESAPLLPSERYGDSEAVGENGVTAESEIDAGDGEVAEFVPISVSIKAYFRYTDAYYTEVWDSWYSAKSEISEKLTVVFVFALSALILFIYLLWVCGRAADGECKTLLYDRIFVEINLIILTAICAAAIVMSSLLFDAAKSLLNTGLFTVLSCIAATLSYLGILNCVLSLVRNAKSGMLFKRSLTVFLAGLAYKYAVSAARFAAEKARRFILYSKQSLGAMKRILSQKIYVYVILLFTFYSVAVFVLTVIFISAHGAFVPALIGLVIYICSLFAIAKAISGFEVLKKGILSMRDGEIGKKIVGCPDGIVGDMAKAINEISTGLAIAVENETKAERMKAELITNVSHDLKTPLTSIINYSNLLCDMKLSPSEANDYAKIIKNKSERLKNMTQDLFDISKAQSGNEKANLEVIDLAVLARQSAAEHESSAQKQGLSVILSVPEGSYTILADGKKLSRVFDNLLINAVKYSLSGTRIYITLSRSDTKVRAEVKNISAYPLDFDPNEITERFVRGEKSRTTEGNGLGLAIAKSYTELCGGCFSIVTDGDLFKAALEFDYYGTAGGEGKSVAQPA